MSETNVESVAKEAREKMEDHSVRVHALKGTAKAEDRGSEPKEIKVKPGDNVRVIESDPNSATYESDSVRRERLAKAAGGIACAEMAVGNATLKPVPEVLKEEKASTKPYPPTHSEAALKADKADTATPAAKASVAKHK